MYFESLNIDLCYPQGLNSSTNVTLALHPASFVRLAYYFNTAPGEQPGITVDNIVYLTEGFLVEYDNIPPAFVDCPSDMYFYLNTSSSVNVTWAPPNVTDSKTIVSEVSTMSPPQELPVQTSGDGYLVKYTVRDGNDNTVSLEEEAWRELGLIVEELFYGV